MSSFKCFSADIFRCKEPVDVRAYPLIPGIFYVQQEEQLKCRIGNPQNIVFLSESYNLIIIPDFPLENIRIKHNHHPVVFRIKIKLWIIFLRIRELYQFSRI